MQAVLWSWWAPGSAVESPPPAQAAAVLGQVPIIAPATQVNDNVWAFQASWSSKLFRTTMLSSLAEVLLIPSTELLEEPAELERAKTAFHYVKGTQSRVGAVSISVGHPGVRFHPCWSIIIFHTRLLLENHLSIFSFQISIYPTEKKITFSPMLLLPPLRD